MTTSGFLEKKIGVHTESKMIASTIKDSLVTISNFALQGNLAAQKELFQILGIKNHPLEMTPNEILVLLFKKNSDIIRNLDNKALRNIIWDRELLLNCYHFGIRNFSGVVLNNIDLSNADLRESDFENATFNYVKFDKHTRLTHANWNHAKFNHVTFPKKMFISDSKKIDDFTHSFSLIKTHQVTLDQKTFLSLYHTGVRNFNYMVLDNLDFRKVKFDHRVSFHGASLKKSNFCNVDISQCDFMNANLEHANLTKAKLTYTWSETSSDSSFAYGEYNGGGEIYHRINTNFYGANLKNTCFSEVSIHRDINLQKTIYEKFCSTYDLKRIIPYLAHQEKTPLKTLQNLLKMEYLKTNGVKRFFTLSLGRNHIAEVKSIVSVIDRIMREEKNCSVLDIYRILNPETIQCMTRRKGTLFSIFEFAFLHEEIYKRNICLSDHEKSRAEGAAQGLFLASKLPKDACTIMASFMDGKDTAVVSNVNIAANITAKETEQAFIRGGIGIMKS